MTPVLGPVEVRLVLDLAGLPSLRSEHADPLGSRGDTYSARTLSALRRCAPR